LSDKSGNCDYLDSIFRIERIREDFYKVCKRIGVSPIALGHENKTRHRPYEEYYKNDNIINKVSEYFRKDFDFFGYELWSK